MNQAVLSHHLRVLGEVMGWRSTSCFPTCSGASSLLYCELMYTAESALPYLVIRMMFGAGLRPGCRRMARRGLLGGFLIVLGGLLTMADSV